MEEKSHEIWWIRCCLINLHHTIRPSGTFELLSEMFSASIAICNMASVYGHTKYQAKHLCNGSIQFNKIFTRILVNICLFRKSTWSLPVRSLRTRTCIKRHNNSLCFLYIYSVGKRKDNVILTEFQLCKLSQQWCPCDSRAKKRASVLPVSRLSC